MEPIGIGWFVPALAFTLAMTATPGPNNAMVTASGATWGFRPTLPHILGIAVGFAVMVFLVAVGAGELMRGQPWIQTALRWFGAAYMLYLAWQIATAQPRAPEPGRAAGRPFSFLQAALFQWVNPKAWVAAVGAVVTYTTATGAAWLVQAALLAAMFLIVAVPILSLWTLAGVGAARVLRTPRALRVFNLVMAGLLVASVVPMLLE